MSPTVIAIAKAITGALLAFLTALATAAQSGGITAQEWLTAIIAFVVAGGAVFSVPYQPLPSKQAPPAVEPPPTAPPPAEPIKRQPPTPPAA